MLDLAIHYSSTRAQYVALLLVHDDSDIVSKKRGDIMFRSALRTTFSIKPSNTLRERVSFRQQHGPALTYDDWLNVVSNDGWMLTETPQEFYDKKLLLAAVKKYGPVLEKIDFTSLQNKMSDADLTDICFASLHNGYSLRHVPARLLTQEMCDIAVRNCGRALQFVPEKFQHDQMYWDAVRENFSSLEFVPYEKRTQKLCDYAFSKCVWAFENTPDEFKSANMCEQAVKIRPEYYSEVPLSKRSTQMREFVLERLGKAPSFEPNKARARSELTMLFSKYPPNSPEIIQALYGKAEIYKVGENNQFIRDHVAEKEYNTMRLKS